MKKSEKIEIKKVMVPMLSNMFDRERAEVVSRFPFLEQEDDDIEDDLPELVEPVAKKAIDDNPFNYADTNWDDDEEDWETVDNLTGGKIQLIAGAAYGYEEGYGIYLSEFHTFMINVSSQSSGSNPGINIVPVSTVDQIRYLESVGYVVLDVSKMFKLKSAN